MEACWEAERKADFRQRWPPKKLMRADVDSAYGQSTMDVHPLTFGARTPF